MKKKFKYLYDCSLVWTAIAGEESVNGKTQAFVWANSHEEAVETCELGWDGVRKQLLTNKLTSPKLINTDVQVVTDKDIIESNHNPANIDDEDWIAKQI